MKLVFSALLAAILLGASLAAAAAAEVEQTIVYLECVGRDGGASKGTGVIVSPQGHVLTARHITLGEGATCKGSIGFADPSAMRKMIVQPAQVSVDAALLRFTESRVYDFATSCTLEDWMVRRRIFIAGFSNNTTGVPSFREGVLSTVFPGPDGIIETDGQSASGMGGAPVFTSNLGALVGIVQGARYSQYGTIESYEILPIALYAQNFGLGPSTLPCYHRTREVDFSGRVSTWKKGDEPVKLGVHANDGICFIAGFWGEFNNALDSVKVELEGDEYVLTGDSQSGGQIGASARCMWYD